ncbi:NAD-dependent succinate-semialdehyde dehydrogenase [Salibacterium halotolerans]|uniref:Succinate-semialdehyde dehydrogenase / glutarate-semialdehyde dehydrogenase n=1 Tax=Salibacterium halotolerans TaxID=1884432 RepID=A0A1I5VTW5_9BACI|nr:NAD-dependent succinate-semialdehyde dehydrogenase [Salibacterium halotolerans]SFQ10833.1 succinate-semialdehyde dehydrogenase / glutarate-semialdehyde dehydrogenase [Salibacterium halotolerans]
METRLFINGTWKKAANGTFAVKNPANNEEIGQAADGGADETKEAIEAAEAAFPSWSHRTAGDRASYLKEIHRLMMEKQDELGELITREMGKPLHEAKGEVAYAASFLEWFAEEGRRIYGDTIPAGSPDKRMMVLHQPVGVTAAITPWNFPQAMVTRKVAPALAAGCPVVLKPAEDTPLSAVRFAEICEEAGLPDGVFNLITGEDAAAIGGELMGSQAVRKMTFTGSTGVGQTLMEQGASDIKKLSLELGGHAPVIVLDDADMEKAVDGTVASKFRNAGQTCVCGNRIYVEEAIHDTFVDRLKEEVEKLQVGDGFAEGTSVGPMINKEGWDKVDRHVKDALDKGAELVTGGRGWEENGGWFYEPTILKNVTSDMIIMEEETFGPVAPIQKVSSDEEAVRHANNSPFGLASYFFTESMSRGVKTAEGLEFGIVGWNDGRPSAAQAPFGGWKQSGIGREGGHEGIKPFLETKYISIGL